MNSALPLLAAPDAALPVHKVHVADHVRLTLHRGIVELRVRDRDCAPSWDPARGRNTHLKTRSARIARAGEPRAAKETRH